jgi:hypothetical protein
MGRPKGSGNVKETVQVVPSRCAACGSTRRSGYLDKTVQQFSGIAPDGKPFNRIVRRRTRCLDCDQLRIDRSLEYEPE